VRLLGGAERHRQSDDPDWFNSFPAEAIDGLGRFFEMFSIKAHFVEGCEEKDFSLVITIDEDFDDVPLSIRILVTSHLVMWTVTTMASVWRNEARFTSWDEKVMCM
jgi:hypothetical protein